MEKELSVSIDEITLMLFPTKENSILDWDENRKEMIQIFLDKSKLKNFMDKRYRQTKANNRAILIA